MYGAERARILTEINRLTQLISLLNREISTRVPHR